MNFTPLCRAHQKRQEAKGCRLASGAKLACQGDGGSDWSGVRGLVRCLQQSGYFSPRRPSLECQDFQKVWTSSATSTLWDTLCMPKQIGTTSTPAIAATPSWPTPSWPWTRAATSWTPGDPRSSSCLTWSPLTSRTTSGSPMWRCTRCDAYVCRVTCSER